MLIRPATLADVPAMARIRATEWKTEEYWQQRIAAYLTGTAHPQHALATRVIYVAQDADTITAFAAGHLTTRFQCDGELQWINVAPEHRGQGIASALFGKLAEWFLAHNASRICVDVDPKNETARRFYAAHGATELNKHWMVWEQIKPRSSP